MSPTRLSDMGSIGLQLPVGSCCHMDIDVDKYGSSIRKASRTSAHRTPTTPAGSGRCGARRSGIKGEPARAEDSRGAECRADMIPPTTTRAKRM